MVRRRPSTRVHLSRSPSLLKRLLASSFRISFGIGFLVVVAGVGLGRLVWPQFSDLDTYRPEITQLLIETTGRPITIGRLEAALLPQPYLLAREVTVFDRENPKRPLVATSRLRIRFYAAPLLRWHKIRPKEITFEAPRVFLTRDTTTWADLLKDQWPAGNKSGDHRFPLEQVSFQNGTAMVNDMTVAPMRRYEATAVNGYFWPQERRGEVSGQVAALGPQATVTLTIHQNDSYPLRLAARYVDLAALHPFAPKLVSWLHGGMDVEAQLRSLHDLEFRISRLRLDRWADLSWNAQGTVEGERLQAVVETSGTVSAMRVEVTSLLRADPLDIQATVRHYSPEITRRLTAIPWITRVEGPGTAHVIFRRSLADNVQEWIVEGSDFRFAGTSLDVRTVRVSGQGKAIRVDTHVKTAHGDATVVWERNPLKPADGLSVRASSITVREVLDVFQRPRMTAAEAAAPHVMRPRAWESLVLQNVRLSSRVLPHKSFLVDRARFQTLGTAIEGTGRFGLEPTGSRGHVEAQLHHIPLETVEQAFFTGKTYLTGTAGAECDLDFPLMPEWVPGLQGQISLHAEDGILRSFQTLYKVLSVLNLTNYMTLRLPKWNDEGIPYQSLAGHFDFDHGVLSTEDLFVRTENSNIGAEGLIDFPRHEVDVKIRIQFFRFIEQLFRNIPGIKWIFKDQHKILLPMVVKVRGPWEAVEVQ